MKSWSYTWVTGKVQSEFEFYQYVSMKYKQHDTTLWEFLPCWPMAFGVPYFLGSGIKGKWYKSLQNSNHRFEKHSIFLACHCYLKQF